MALDSIQKTQNLHAKSLKTCALLKVLLLRLHLYGLNLYNFILVVLIEMVQSP